MKKIEASCFVYDPKFLVQPALPNSDDEEFRALYNRYMDRKMNETVAVFISDDRPSVDQSVFAPLVQAILGKKK